MKSFFDVSGEVDKYEIENHIKINPADIVKKKIEESNTEIEEDESSEDNSVDDSQEVHSVIENIEKEGE